MKILTQKQAAEQFPDREYEKYDPMILLAGTRKELGKVVLKTKQSISLLDDRNKILAVVSFEETIKERRHVPSELGNIDVDKANGKDTRIVLWKR